MIEVLKGRLTTIFPLRHLSHGLMGKKMVMNIESTSNAPKRPPQPKPAYTIDPDGHTLDIDFSHCKKFPLDVLLGDVHDPDEGWAKLLKDLRATADRDVYDYFKRLYFERADYWTQTIFLVCPDNCLMPPKCEKAIFDSINRLGFDIQEIHLSPCEDDHGDSQPELKTKTLERVVQKKVNWLWRDKIPSGYVTVLAGEAGVGKSTIMCSIVGRLTTKWSREVLLIADEDNEEDTLVPRLNAAGADLTKVHHMGEVAWEDEKNGYAFEILRDLPKLEHWLAEHPGVKLIVIDPWLNYLGNKNGYSAQEVRQVLMPMQGLAQRLGIAIVCICHFKKGSAEKANERIGGSAAIVQVPRSVLLVGEVKQENGVLYGELHQTKHNLNPRHEGKQYQIVGAVSKRNGTSITTCRVKWGSDSKKDAEALFAAKDPKERSLDLCCQWMTEVLSDGELPAKQVIHSGKEKGFSQRTIFRAHGVVAKSRKEPKTNRAFWYLP
jgi:putative DNA primase/helicase